MTPLKSLFKLLIAPTATLTTGFYQHMFKPVYAVMNVKERVCLILGLLSTVNVLTKRWKLLWLVCGVLFLRQSLHRHWNVRTYQAHVKPPLKKGVLSLLDKLI